MGRWKKPTKEEIQTARDLLSQRARTGDLRFPDAIVDIRKAFGVTQEQFANLLGMTRRQIAEIETGVANPTRDTLERIGKLFGFTVGFVPRTPREQPDSGMKP